MLCYITVFQGTSLFKESMLYKIDGSIMIFKWSHFRIAVSRETWYLNLNICLKVFKVLRRFTVWNCVLSTGGHSAAVRETGGADRKGTGSTGFCSNDHLSGNDSIRAEAWRTDNKHFSSSGACDNFFSLKQEEYSEFFLSISKVILSYTVVGWSACHR